MRLERYQLGSLLVGTIIYSLMFLCATLTNQDLENEFGSSSQYTNMKIMLASKNKLIKELRSKLLEYDLLSVIVYIVGCRVCVGWKRKGLEHYVGVDETLLKAL